MINSIRSIYFVFTQIRHSLLDFAQIRSHLWFQISGLYLPHASFFLPTSLLLLLITSHEDYSSLYDTTHQITLFLPFTPNQTSLLQPLISNSDSLHPLISKVGLYLPLCILFFSPPNQFITFNHYMSGLPISLYDKFHQINLFLPFTPKSDIFTNPPDFAQIAFLQLWFQISGLYSPHASFFSPVPYCF
jgi:hypothetical protein